MLSISLNLSAHCVFFKKHLVAPATRKHIQHIIVIILYKSNAHSEAIPSTTEITHKYHIITNSS
jgi:hypothetical protein